MKRYVSCFLFFFSITAASLIGLFYITREIEQNDIRQVQAAEPPEHPHFAEETLHVVLNQEYITADVDAELYCLVAEEGYLIVYDTSEETVSLFTHMPLMDFPAAEQERLLEGIWFATMAEIFSYLESYSS